MKTNEIRTVTDWLKTHLSQINYGQVVITVTVHDGEVRQVDKTFTESVRPVTDAS